MIPKTRKEAFKVLELSESANNREITVAYRKLALEWHPDRNKGNEEQAKKKFQEISKAYEILTGKANDSWVDELYKRFKNMAKERIEELIKERYGSHLRKEKVDLFEVLDSKNLVKTKILLEKVENINIQTRPFGMWIGKSIFHYIVENSCDHPGSGWIELLEEVLSRYSTNNPTSTKAINVNIWGDNSTPLHIACELGSLDVINMLLDHGANPNAYVYANADTYTLSKYTPLYYAVEGNKDHVIKVLLEHDAKIGVDPLEEASIISSIRKYSQDTVEVLLPHVSNRQKSRMLQAVAFNVDAETDHDIEIAKLLLEAGADPKFCGETEKGESNASALYWANLKGKNKLVKLFNEHEKNVINNNSHPVEKQGTQSSITDNTEHNSPQKQQPSGTSPKGWTIGLALLFGAVGATLVAVGIMPEVAAIGIIATAVLLGIAGAALGGAVGYLTDTVVNKCHSKTTVQV